MSASQEFDWRSARPRAKLETEQTIICGVRRSMAARRLAGCSPEPSTGGVAAAEVEGTVRDRRRLRQDIGLGSSQWRDDGTGAGRVI